MPAGRPRTPTPIKILNGNPGHRPINDEEPKPKSGPPPCPDHIEGEERAEWERVTRELSSMNIATEVDRASLEGYCTWYAMFRECKDAMHKRNEYGNMPSKFVKTSSGYVQVNPNITLMKQAYAEMCKFWQEYGLTAASRTRIRIEKPAEEDSFEAYQRMKRA